MQHLIDRERPEAARVLAGHELATTQTFDHADRLVRTVHPDGQALVHAYDGASRPTAISRPSWVRRIGPSPTSAGATTGGSTRPTSRP